MTKTSKQEKTNTKRKSHFGWLPRLLIKPRSTIHAVLDEEKPCWLTPLLVISILVLLAVLVTAPIKRQNIQMGATIPEDFMYWSPEMQEQYIQSQQNLISPTFMYLFPALSGLAGIWFFWLIFSSLLYLSLTLAGSRSARVKTNNLTAWAMLPFALRKLVEILVALFSKQLVVNPGFSNLVAAEAEGGLAFLRGLLGNIDIYWLWFVVLLLLGVVPLSGLKRSKAVLTTLVTVGIMLILQALPKLIASLMRGLSGSSMGFYF